MAETNRALLYKAPEIPYMAEFYADFDWKLDIPSCFWRSPLASKLAASPRCMPSSACDAPILSSLLVVVLIELINGDSEECLVQRPFFIAPRLASDP